MAKTYAIMSDGGHLFKIVRKSDNRTVESKLTRDEARDHRNQLEAQERHKKQ